MPKTPLCQSFERTRVRLQRLSDSRFFTGWVTEIKNERIAIRLNSFDEFDSEEEFFLQAYGDGQTAIFRAKFILRSGARSSFVICSEPQFVASSEEVRVRVSNLKCTVKIGWFESVAEVIDISPNGIGLQARASIERAEVISLTMVTCFGEIHSKGEVCYSKTMDGLTGAYRIGVELYPMDRLNKAKWNQLLKSFLLEFEAA